MRLEEFEIGRRFAMGDATWLCTDKGTRVVTAIKVSGARLTTVDGDGEQSTEEVGGAELERDGWLDGPPYALAESVIDEDDQVACEPIDPVMA